MTERVRSGRVVAASLALGLALGFLIGQRGPRDTASAQGQPAGCTQTHTVPDVIFEELVEYNRDLATFIDDYRNDELREDEIEAELQDLHLQKLGILRNHFPQLFGKDFIDLYELLDAIDSGLARADVIHHRKGRGKQHQGFAEEIIGLLQGAKAAKEELEETLRGSACLTDPPSTSPIGANSTGTATEYFVDASDPDGARLMFEWSKSPERTCGTFTSEGNRARWDHPHPPCPEEAAHPGTVSVSISDGTWICRAEYPNGSAPGTGPEPGPCEKGTLAEFPPRCLGRDPTILGTPGPDSLEATAGQDVVFADGGDDTIRGLGGDDLLCGGPGNDRVLGGDGNDELSGSFGRDRLTGDKGNDVLFGGLENDLLLSGGAGRDRCEGGPGKRDRILAGGKSGCEVLR